MTDRWKDVEAILRAALARSPHERAAFVAATCGGDRELRLEVESLLAHDNEVDQLLSTPAVALIAAPEAPAAFIGRQLGTYTVLDWLGSGGMGDVYRARDRQLDRDVAIKILPPVFTNDSDRLARFEREAKILAALNHPHIGAIYGLERVDGSPALVLELVEGPTLADRLSRGALSVEDAPAIAIQVADALEAAHRQGIVHRDLKPSNIKMTADGLVKLLDFGLAKGVEPDSSDAAAADTFPITTSRPGAIMGTAAYMSPEQARGEPVDARSDLFSLGAVMYEMITGRPAFSGATASAIFSAILNDAPSSPRTINPSLPASLERLVMRLLAKDPSARHQRASDVRSELQRLAVRVPVDGASDAQTIAGVVSRHRRVALAAGALLLPIAAIAGYLATRPTPVVAVIDRSPRLSIADLVIRQLTATGTARAPVISPDGNYVAYVEQGTESDSLRVRHVTTGINVEILPPEPGIRLFAPAVSPDGTFVNYLRRHAAQPPELWQIPSLGGAPRRLLTGIGSGVAFSADGRRMAYVRSDDAGLTEVVVAASDGSGAKVLATRRLPNDNFLTFVLNGFGQFAPAWSPDGKTVAVLGARTGFKGQVVFIDTATGGQRAVDFGPAIPGFSLAWLDEATLILSAVDRPSAPTQLWRMSYSKGDLSRLTNDLTQYIGLAITADRNQLVTAQHQTSFSIWTSDATAAQWREEVPATPTKGPIGFEVAWLDDDLLFASSGSGAWGLERWRASTRRTEMLAPSAGSPQVSSDGSTILFIDYDAGELWKMSADGRSKTRLSGYDRIGRSGRITPDGRKLTFVDTAGGSSATVRIRPIDGRSAGRVITADRVRAGSALVSPDGQWIAYSSFDDQNRPAIRVCDLATCTSKRTGLPPTPAQWMPDSRALAHVDPRTGSDLWVQPLDDSAPRQLTHFPPDGRRILSFAWSANGQRLAVGRVSMTSDIVLFRGLRGPTR